ncbi:MAG: NAD-binding protein [Elusimicrobiota bacterium]
MYIVIVGAGKVGYNLAKLLLKGEHEVSVIEKSKERYSTVVDDLGEAVIYGDGVESTVLKEAGANRADVLVAVTGDDEDNLVICQMAKVMFLVPRTIARINDPENEDIFTGLGIDATVSSTMIINSLIEQKVDATLIMPLLTLNGGNIEVVQAEMSGSSALANKLVSQIKLPPDCILIAVLRANEIIIPRGDTLLKANDVIISLVKKENEKALYDLLA